VDTPPDRDAVKDACGAAPLSQAQNAPAWRAGLPPLCGRYVLLREPTQADVEALAALIGPDDAPRFGITDGLSIATVSAFIDRAGQSRASGASFT
jgi:hypothetical protein